MRVLVCLAQSGDRLSIPFQYLLNAAMLGAADAMRGNPLPPLYKIPLDRLVYRPEPTAGQLWAGQPIEVFDDPWTVYERGFGDCDDLVIWRGAELIVNGYPCHARVLYNPDVQKYHTQVARDFGSPPCVEDPSLQRLGRPVSEWLTPCS